MCNSHFGRRWIKVPVSCIALLYRTLEPAV
jgi:hypothetical protein